MTAARSYGAQLRHWAEGRPDALAVTVVDPAGAEESLTFVELLRRATALAHRLAAAGVTPDDIVPICLPPSPQVFVALFGVWLLGACPAPLRYDAPEPERERLLRLIAPKVLIGGWAVDGQRIPAEALREESAAQLSDMTPKRMWAVGSGGSTGAPKLIVSLRPASVAAGYGVMLEGGSGEQACQILCGPLYHTHALSLGLGSLLCGDRVVATQRFDARQVLQLIERHRAAMIGLVPTMMIRMLRVLDKEPFDLSSLKLLLCGAGALPPPIAERWMQIIGPDRFMVGYGSSEGAGQTRITGEELRARPGSVGRPFASDVRIIDEAGAPCPPGEVGEIYLRAHEGRTFHYLGAPDPPATDDGFVSIGDLGWLDADGYLFIADRRTDMVKTGGVNVFPAEVEGCLLQHPDVADVAVIGLPDAEWGRRLHAVIAPADVDDPPAPQALAAFCKARLSSAKVPKTYEFVERLPRNEAMKINRRQLTDERTTQAARA